jgi:hypothetical protein
MLILQFFSTQPEDNKIAANGLSPNDFRTPLLFIEFLENYPLYKHYIGLDLNSYNKGINISFETLLIW